MAELVENKSYKVLIGCTGSVAAIKLPILVEKLIGSNIELRVVVTESAKHFYNAKDIHPDVKVYDDHDEWSMWSNRGDPVLHIELSKWADVFVIAPLDANTLAKLAQGLCDNLLTCIARAWNPTKPLLFCPAMNTQMWEHPITSTQINTMKSWGFQEIPCVSKLLMCGDFGFGAMAEVSTIVSTVLDVLKLKETVQ